MRTLCLFRICVLVTIILAGRGDRSEAFVSADDQTQGIRFFETQIRPVLVERCYSCHSKAAGKQEGGLFLDSRADWLKGGERGPAVQAGEPEHSLLLTAVRYVDTDLQMPPTEKLSDEQISAFEIWIRMGAPAPDGDMAAGIDHPSDPFRGREHWANQKLRKVEIPNVQRTDWPSTSLDYFILARLESEGLSPIEDAAPGDLVRRLCLQLTGLPPSEEQHRRYAAGFDGGSPEQLVDELLGSPEVGRRWGRHWLDLARYADSNGLDENFLFREAWRYRNWVIDAVNEDMPFDQFLLEQLAGDLLPFETVEQRDRYRTAAGFLVVGPKVLLGVDPNRQRMDVADEQLDTVGRVVLGQTLGCARCHDHKFDPIPTKDYYALAGIFTSTQVMQQRFMLGEQRVMERLCGLGAEGDVRNNEYETFWRELPSKKALLQRVTETLNILKSGDDVQLEARLKADQESFAEEARISDLTKEARTAAQDAFRAHLDEVCRKTPARPPRAMVPGDVEKPADEAIRKSGKYDDIGDSVPRGFLQVLIDDVADARDTGNVPPVIPPDRSGRIELSRWLTDSQTRAGALAARVQANRIWHHLIGCGIVRTVDNFGRTGEAPSHPELLDFLAGRLIDLKWSRKALIREIVLSRTFSLSSRIDSTMAERDPENRLLWRAHRRRLEPEVLRDAMLSAAGMLDFSPCESTVEYLGDQATAVGMNTVRRRTDAVTRSVYLPVIRNDLPEIFEVFDFANPHFATGARSQTTVPTQGLFMLNDPQVMEAAEKTAARILSSVGGESSQSSAGGDATSEKLPDSIDGRIDRAFQLICSGTASETERSVIRESITGLMSRLQTETSIQDQSVELRAWSLVCHALFASSRFQYSE
jgi:hypothetical protein